MLRSIATVGDAMNWRADLRAAGIERRPSSNNNPDRGFVEQPGEGVPDKPPPSVPRLPPHSQRPSESVPVLRRPATSLTPAPEPPRDRDLFPPLPLPSVESTPKSEAPQTLVKVERATPLAAQPKSNGGNRPRRYWVTPEDVKEKALARFAELGGLETQGAQSRVAKEFDLSGSQISRWLHPKKETREMPKNKHKGGAADAYPEEVKDKWVKKAIAYGRGGQARVARESGITEATISLWCIAYKKRQGPSSTTMVSSSKAPASRVASNGHTELPPFLQGLDTYINQLVDARVKEAVKEVLRTTSLMELMKQ